MRLDEGSPHPDRGAAWTLGAAFASAILGGLSLLLTLPILPFISQVTDAERFAAVPAPPAWVQTCFMLAPCFGIAGVVLFVVVRHRATRLDTTLDMASENATGASHASTPPPDQPNPSAPSRSRVPLLIAQGGIGLAITSAAIWLFYVGESLSQSGAP